MTIFTIPAYGGGGGGSPGPPGPAGDSTYFLQFVLDSAVPESGIRFLSLAEGAFGSLTGGMLPADGTIVGLSFAANAADPNRTFDVNVLTDPSGTGGTGPTATGATLNIGLSTLRDRVRGISFPVAGLLDIGVEIRRASGPAAPSVFTKAVVFVEVTIP